jgi:hypothetical protein
MQQRCWSGISEYYHDEMAGKCTTATLPLNTWFYLMAVFDDAANTYKIYVNGTLVASQTETSTMQPNTQSLVFGQSGCAGCGYEHWRGLIDEVRIYNRALSPSEFRTT